MTEDKPLEEDPRKIAGEAEHKLDEILERLSQCIKELRKADMLKNLPQPGEINEVGHIPGLG